jgi:hypothetical protein
LASSLFRPRRVTSVIGGVFLLIAEKLTNGKTEGAHAMKSRPAPGGRDYWTLDGSVARFTCGGLAGSVDVRAAHRGLHELEFDGAGLPGFLMGVRADAERVETLGQEPAANLGAASDAYIRGQDLVATYRETEARRFTVQCYWRVGPLSGGVGGRPSAMVDAIVSIQTRQWEAFPSVSVSSAMPAEASQLLPKQVGGGECGEMAILFSLPDRPWSYGETTYPGDFSMREVGAEADGVRRTRWSFGRKFMERGVIRRLRLRGVFASMEDDADTLRRLQRALAAEDPPLTA